MRAFELASGVACESVRLGHFEPVTRWKWQPMLANAGKHQLMAQSIRRGGYLLLGAVLSAACGNGDDLDPFAGQDAEYAPVSVAPAQVPSPPAEQPARPPVSAPPVNSPVSSATDDPEDVVPSVVPPVSTGNGCVTPLGVSGTPRTLSEAIILMNSLPRPTTLACFLQALSRPLDVYMTSSDDSLQPSPGPRSPRTFIVFEPLVMSVVFDGPARIALELGYRTTATRSIKTEILFPLTTDVTSTNLFDEVKSGEEATRCGACHTGEVQTVNPDLPVDVFESDILTPFDFEEVDVTSLRAERESCNPALEADRCAMLSALFDFGTVQPAPDGILFKP
jgi:hypothetical protein